MTDEKHVKTSRGIRQRATVNLSWEPIYWNYVTTALAVLGLLIGWWGLHQGTKIANDQRDYLQGEVVVAVLDKPVKSKNFSIYYRVPKNCPSSLLVDLPITIVNSGESPVDRAEVSIGMKTIDGASGLLDESLNEFMSFDGALKRDVSRSFSQTEKWAYVYYEIDRLVPGMSFTFREMLPLLSGSVSDTVSFQTKDGANMTADYHFDFAVSYSLVVSWNNLSLDTYTLTIVKLEADSLQEAAEMIDFKKDKNNQIFLLELEAEKCEQESRQVLTTKKAISFSNR